MPVEHKVERVFVEVTVTYADVDGLRRLMKESDVTVEDEEYGAEVRYSCGFSASVLDTFRGAVAEVTRGAGVVREDRWLRACPAQRSDPG